MVDNYTRESIKLCVAQICQVIGWNSIQTTPLELITDIVQDYIKGLARTTYNYAVLYGQTEPNLDHLGLAFKDMGVCLSELEEYINYVDTMDMVQEVPKYPVPRNSNLNHLKPGSREVVTRPFHIHEHLPPMHPHLEDQGYPLKQSPVSVDVMSTVENTSPLSSPKGNVFKRPGDPIPSDGSHVSRRPRQLFEDEVRPLREISSVMMTTSGFLSPAREGKLPEARTPSVNLDCVSSTELVNSQVVNSQIETKSEKKKKGKTIIETVKKNDKENKGKEEVGNDSLIEDENKVKKLVSMKETSKLKAFKSGALKTQSPGGTKIQKSNVQKVRSCSSSPMPVTHSNSFKNTKSLHNKSPKADKIAMVPSASKEQIQSTCDSINSSTEGKLFSEPDKQKLNIFRKISKVKEEHGALEFPDIKSEPEDIHSAWTPVDDTIEAVIQNGRNEIKEEVEIKEEHVDIEGPGSPSHYEPVVYSDDPSLPDTPSTPRTPELPRLMDHRKRKKEKHKDKRDLKEKYVVNSSLGSKPNKYVSETEVIAKPKTPEVDMTPEESTPTIVFPFFTNYHSAPGLIPPPISHPLIPHLPMSLKKHPSIQPLPLHSPNVSSVNSIRDSQISDSSFQTSALNCVPSVSSCTLNLTTTQSNQPLQSPVKQNEIFSMKKREHKKDKKLKDKVKKKKEKKDKSKSKDKSEKRKIKLEKKERDKEKAKLKKEKKEKKKEKEMLDDKLEINAVPKITFKLGPASPQESSPDSTHCKIVIKPLVKKEDEIPVKSDRAPSPELARISPLLPRPTKHKSLKNIGAVDDGGRPLNPTVVNSTQQAISVEKPEPPVAVRLDNEGNEVWICPGCGRQDDGSPMVGCDGCDAWYHWVCVGIQVPPESNEWFCPSCISKKTNEDSERSDKKKKNRKKKLPH